MPCCGKVKQSTSITKGQKVGRIVKGTVRKILGKKCPSTDARIKTCRSCEENTWLKISEYVEWLLKHGIEVISNFEQLEKLPKLPKQNTGKNIYCRICKCYIPDKARVEEEKCPLGKWEK